MDEGECVHMSGGENQEEQDDPGTDGSLSQDEDENAFDNTHIHPDPTVMQLWQEAKHLSQREPGDL